MKTNNRVFHKIMAAPPRAAPKPTLDSSTLYEFNIKLDLDLLPSGRPVDELFEDGEDQEAPEVAAKPTPAPRKPSPPSRNTRADSAMSTGSAPRRSPPSFFNPPVRKGKKKSLSLEAAAAMPLQPLGSRPVNILPAATPRGQSAKARALAADRVMKALNRDEALQGQAALDASKKALYLRELNRTLEDNEAARRKNKEVSREREIRKRDWGVKTLTQKEIDEEQLWYIAKREEPKKDSDIKWREDRTSGGKQWVRRRSPDGEMIWVTL